MRRALAALSLSAALCVPGFAHAEEGDEPKKEKEQESEPPKKEGDKELHGSQGASSQWLPIILGGLAGMAVGAIAGTQANNQNPTLGPIVGVATGGIAGGGGGAWFIRNLREQDTTVAGTLTGLGIGGGLGALIAVNVDPGGRTLETIGKWSAAAILPLMGALVGHRLAVVWMKPTKKEEPKPEPAAGFVRPTFGPVVAATGKSSGFSLGLEGAF